MLATNQTGDTLARILTLADQTGGRGEISYGALKKNSSRYKGALWSFSGRIQEIHEDASGTQARISVGTYYFDADKVIYVKSKFLTKFVEKDGVDVAGFIVDDYTYESQAGWTITVPSMVAFSLQPYGTINKLRKAAAASRKRREVPLQKSAR